MSDSPGKSCLIGLIPSLFAAAVMLAAAGSMALAEGREASEKPLLLVPPAAALAQPELPQLEFPQLKSGVIETNAGPSEAESSEEPPKSEAESAVGSGPEVGTVTATAAPATGGISEEITPGTIKGIEVNTLAAIAPDAIGTLDPDDGGFGIEMWRGSDRQVVLSLLRRLPDDLQSRNLHSLARRLLMSIAAPPSSGTELYTSEQTGLLALRLERLAILGEIPGLNDLLAAVPSHTDDQKIARLRIDSLLLVNNVDEACRQVRNGIASFHQIPYWRKAMVLCQMVAGEVDKVMLGLDLLREQGISDDPVFFALTGSMFGGEAMLPPDASLSPLHFAMLRVTGTPLPPGSLDRASPGLLTAIARAQSIEIEQRARAAEMACGMGLLSGAVLAEVYDAFSFTPEELANAISAVETMEGPRLRALLYQAARSQSLPATRAEVLRVALEQAEKAGVYQAVLPVFLPLLTEMSVAPELAWFAMTAGRALYAAGRYEHASAWLMLSRQEGIINAQASTAAAALWPYSRLAGGAALTTDGDLTAWRDMREGMAGGAGGDGSTDTALSDRQALLRAAFQALGERDSLSWSLLAANGAREARPLPNAAFLYALDEASESRRLGETVLLALIVLGEDGPAASHTYALSAVLSALSRVGLEREARAIAIEAALANGV